MVDLRLNATFRSVMAILGNESDARDVTQTIFVQAWTNLPNLRDPAPLSAWFGRIVVHSARSALRGRRVERPRDPGECDCRTTVLRWLRDNRGTRTGRPTWIASSVRSNVSVQPSEPCSLHHYEGLSWLTSEPDSAFGQGR